GYRAPVRGVALSAAASGATPCRCREPPPESRSRVRRIPPARSGPSGRWGTGRRARPARACRDGGAGPARRADPASGWSSESGSRSRRAGSWSRVASLPPCLDAGGRLSGPDGLAGRAVDHFEEVIDAGQAEELLDV